MESASAVAARARKSLSSAKDYATETAKAYLPEAVRSYSREPASPPPGGASSAEPYAKMDDAKADACEPRCLGFRCSGVHARFELQQGWRVAFGTGKLFPSLGARGLLAVRASLFATWLAISAWSFLDDVLNTTRSVRPGSMAESELEPHLNDGALHWADWLTKLTHWTLLLQLAYLLLGLLTTALALHSSLPDAKGPQTPWFVRLTWALGATTAVSTFLVMLLYWVLVWPFSKEFPAIPSLLTACTHGVNFVLALTDLLLAGQPLYLAQCWAPFAFALTYVLFTLGFDLGGGTSYGLPYVYTVLDWSAHPASSAAIGGAVVFVVFPLAFAACIRIKAAHCWGRPPDWYDQNV